jgi:hypothetical protein
MTPEQYYQLIVSTYSTDQHEVVRNALLKFRFTINTVSSKNLIMKTAFM